MSTGKRTADRQSRGHACRAGMMLGLCLFGLALPAAAEVELRLTTTSTLPTAPAVVRWTAETRADAPIVEYRWRFVDDAPRCRGRSCALELATASCRPIAVEVTTALGETATATAESCATDDGHHPPRARLDVRRTSSGWSIEPGDTAGDIPVVRRRLWIDDRRLAVAATELEDDGDCHVVDLLVVDVEGRFGLARVGLCPDDARPDVWLGASPRSCPPADQTRASCGDATDPGGGALIRTVGDAPLSGCGPEEPPPPSLARSVLAVRDGAGRTSWASSFGCGAPTGAGAHLLFVEPGSHEALRVGVAARWTVGLLGGRPGTRLAARLRGPAPRTAILTLTTSVAVARSQGTVEFPPLEIGEYTLELEAEDDDGRRAVETTPVRVEPQRPDAGVLDAETRDAEPADAGPSAADAGRRDAGTAGGAPSRALSSAGCASTGTDGLAPLAALGLASALLARRRRRCC